MENVEAGSYKAGMVRYSVRKAVDLINHDLTGLFTRRMITQTMMTTTSRFHTM